MTPNESLEPAIKRASRSVAYQWPGVLDAEEVEQEIWLKLLESPGTVEKVLSFDREGWKSFFVRMGQQIASEARTEKYQREGAYDYSVHDVKRLLKSGALTDDELYLGAQTFDGEGVKSSKEPTTHIPVGVTDVRSALLQLAEKREEYAEAIIRRYRLEEFPATKADENNLRRGTDALTVEMNRIRRVGHNSRPEGPGTRPPIGREPARYESKGQWDADYRPAPAHLRDNSIEPEVWA